MRTGHTTTRAFGALALAAAGVIALAGCGAGGTNLKLATGSTGGTYYPLGGEIAEIWSSKVEGVTVSTQSSGASVENMRLLDQGESDLVMAINGVAADAVEGKGDFKEQPLGSPDKVTMLGNVYPEVMQIVATKSSGVEKIEDLKGKRVDIGPPGSGTEVAAREILKAYGIDPEKDIESFQSTFEEAATKLGDGQVDAAFGVLAVPAGSIEQVATTTDINVVEISGDGLEQLKKSNPTYSSMEIPADTYKGQGEPAQTVTNWATLYATSDLEEDVAYNLVKQMYESADEIGHDVGEQVKLDTALEGSGAVDLHPGAERYYQEQGVLD